MSNATAAGVFVVVGLVVIVAALLIVRGYLYQPADWVTHAEGCLPWAKQAG